MTATTVNNRKFLASGALVVLVAAGAYGLGRVYPPLGPSEGTIAPAERYVAAQVGEGDVTLGDTSVPQLMQSDAFEVMTKDPNFRAMAQDPGFAALARSPQAMSAMAANPQAFAALARDPQALPQWPRMRRPPLPPVVLQAPAMRRHSPPWHATPMHSTLWRAIRRRSRRWPAIRRRSPLMPAMPMPLPPPRATPPG